MATYRELNLQPQIKRENCDCMVTDSDCHKLYEVHWLKEWSSKSTLPSTVLGIRMGCR